MTGPTSDPHATGAVSADGDRIGTDYQIYLIRHGQPACLPKERLSQDEFRHWVRAYNSAGILGRPPRSIQDLARNSDEWAIFCSSLPRSVQSAEALAWSGQIRSSPLFDEAAISIAPVRLCLKSSTWILLGRASWLLGASAPEGVAACRARARDAADALANSARNANTALVGHGWMNRMICRELRKRGWKIFEKRGEGYWSHTSLGLEAR